jgi:hypothetical protein
VPSIGGGAVGVGYGICGTGAPDAFGTAGRTIGADFDFAGETLAIIAFAVAVTTSFARASAPFLAGAFADAAAFFGAAFFAAAVFLAGGAAFFAAAAFLPAAAFPPAAFAAGYDPAPFPFAAGAALAGAFFFEPFVFVFAMASIVMRGRSGVQALA